MEIETIAKLTPEDGDLLVVKTDMCLNPEQRQILRHDVTSALLRAGKKCSVLILENGVSVEIIKTSQLPDIDDSKHHGWWSEWHGGECPVSPEKFVDVQFRGKNISHALRAGSVAWAHLATSSDVIAYRVRE